MKTIRNMLLILVLTLSCCNTRTSTREDRDVLDFLELLVGDETPTLAQYQRFAGPGDPGERELAFELQECRRKGWSVDSAACKGFVQKRWSEPEKHKSLYFSWLRNHFSTSNARYRILRRRSSAEGFQHELVDVTIGHTPFILFHNTAPGHPTGVIVSVISAGGTKIDQLIRRNESKRAIPGKGGGGD